MSQQQRLLNYLEEHKKINSFEAFNKLGIWRLPNRISELRAKDYKIESKRIRVSYMFDEVTTISEYTLVGGK